VSHESAYYDSCVFIRSCDVRSPDCAACQALLDPAQIAWRVALSDLCAAESMMKEYVEQFEIQCISLGLEFTHVTMAEIQVAAKTRTALKKRLSNLGCAGRDWKHIMAAVAAAVEVIVTTDNDFSNPKDKARRGKSGTAPVEALLRSELSLVVLSPTAAQLTLGKSA
jgi:hypothetical protein